MTIVTFHCLDCGAYIIEIYKYPIIDRINHFKRHYMPSGEKCIRKHCFTSIEEHAGGFKVFLST